MSLALGEALGFLEVGQVLVICKDGYGVGSASQVLVPLGKGMYDHEEFLVIDVVISFCWGKDF